MKFYDEIGRFIDRCSFEEWNMEYFTLKPCDFDKTYIYKSWTHRSKFYFRKDCPERFVEVKDGCETKNIWIKEK